MMRIPIYQIDAFTDRPFGGNPAAVCPLNEWLPDATLQSIAEENNLSETAFLVEQNGEYALRWFTPTTEVDLCGHATLAAAAALFETSCENQNQIVFHTRSGMLRVDRAGAKLTLDFPVCEGTPCEIPDALESGLGIRSVECFRAMDYMVVLKSETDVRNLDPDFRLLSGLDLRGVIATAPGEDCDFVSRYFAPAYGIDEDPVTGSAHCTLTPYWARRLAKKTLKAVQISKRKGFLKCRVEGDRVFISGSAVLVMRGELFLSK